VLENIAIFFTEVLSSDIIDRVEVLFSNNVSICLIISVLLELWCRIGMLS
jgi:hypothetical protein